MDAKLNILILGGGGREHAIAKSLAASPAAGAIYVAPGNGGTARIAQNVALDAEDAPAVVAFATQHDIDLVVIGPEAPLVAGVADAVRGAGILCFGPSNRGALLEGSKRFAKELMDRHKIPTAGYGSFTDATEANAYLETVSYPIVVKADGLAAGKGVIIAQNQEEATRAVEDCFSGRFGSAGDSIVIEEYLEGPECSLLVFTDGTTVLPMAPAQDHKRAYDGDEGPNTGGMGVYSPVPLVRKEEYARMIGIMEQTVAGIRAEGIDYQGVLYGGFMLTADGPKVLEFNVRFGDPETQVILPRLETDLLDVMVATAKGDLASVDLAWSDDWAVSVVLASSGYPGPFSKGFAITGIEDAEKIEGVTVFQAGTAVDADGELVTAGGRVLNVTAVAPTFESAREKAYHAADVIDFEGKFMRHDIGKRALKPREDFS